MESKGKEKMEYMSNENLSLAGCDEWSELTKISIFQFFQKKMTKVLTKED
jgi:hypothetical protein